MGGASGKSVHTAVAAVSIQLLCLGWILMGGACGWQ